MTNDEARFFLRSFRPDGSDAGDPVFADALSRADRDPAVRAWFERERSNDRAITERLHAAARPSRSPADIIAGIQRRRQLQSYGRAAGWLAAAAAAVLLTVSLTLRSFSPQPDVHQLVRFALTDVSLNRSAHRGTPTPIGPAEAFPGPGGLRAAAARMPDIAALQAANCRVLSIGGREVLEFCFGPNHAFHLYIASRATFDTGGSEFAPLFTEQGVLAAAAWADDRHIYTVATATGADALRALL